MTPTEPADTTRATTAATVSRCRTMVATRRRGNGGKDGHGHNWSGCRLAGGLMMGFEATPLWQMTLAVQPDRDENASQRERLRASFHDLRSNAAVLLNELSRSAPDYTVHDVSHVDAMWETASLICHDPGALNPAEAYVLGCAFVLHDAAMGLAAYRDDIAEVLGKEAWQDLVSMVVVDRTGRWPSVRDMQDLPADLLYACRCEAIRRTHAAHASTLVDQPWTTSARNDFFLLQDTQLREAYGPLIGELAASHWWSVDELPRRFQHAQGSLPWQPVDWTIVPLTLACLLRLADATQIDSRRAPTLLFALRQPQGESREHWRFQEHLSRPQLLGDRITYTCLRPFEPDDAPAWWLALDYLRRVDQELKRVDALLHDLRVPRLAARAVAGVDTPERFAERFPVRDWRPIDVDVHISDVRALIVALGGEQLYGRAPEVALRELVQNAQDAVRARQAIDPDHDAGQVTIALTESAGDWWLEVRDNGLGMDEDIIAHALLDFGRTGWQSSSVRSQFIGLSAGGFKPRGRFGVGFFSVFMIGDDVTVTTRRFDGARDDARRLQFHGLEARPLLTAVPPGERVPPGTSVGVKLKADPMSREGIFERTEDETLANLVQRLLPESSVPVATNEWGGSKRAVLAPFDLDTAAPQEVFDRLYPPRDYGGEFGKTMRLALRDDFTRHATEIIGEGGERLGLAVLGYDFAFWSEMLIRGIVTVNGFRADEHQFFAGYATGYANRASRDNAQLAVDSNGLKRWIQSQEVRKRELEEFSVSTQLELAYTLHRALGDLREDHHIATTSEGVIRLGDIETWARERDEVIWCRGWPLVWHTRPPGLFSRASGTKVALTDDWIVLCEYYWDPFLDVALGRQRDDRFKSARHDRGYTWQKMWWFMSSHLPALLVRRICHAWECDVGDILAPVAARDWGDHRELESGSRQTVPVLHLRRP